jgi:hypothetical protein
MLKSLLLIATLLLSTSIGALSAEDEMSELRKLAVADPVKDFEAAKAKNDIHFVGVLGITIIVPGVDKRSALYRRMETRIVKGTGDVPTSDEQIPLTRKVLIYAERYNKLVLQFLSQKKTNP